MSDRYRLSRLDGWKEGEEGGGWWLLNNSELIFRCPSCHQNGGLGLHEVTAAGEVNASILCDCGWHEFAVLDGWQQGWTKARGSAAVDFHGALPA